MGLFHFEITLDEVNGRITAAIASTIPPDKILQPGDSVELKVRLEEGSVLNAPKIDTIQFFRAENGQPGTMEAIWARIGPEGIFTTSGVIFIAMQATDHADLATFTNVNVSGQYQDAFFTCGGFVDDGENRRSWQHDPEVILRSGEWASGRE